MLGATSATRDSIIAKRATQLTPGQTRHVRELFHQTLVGARRSRAALFRHHAKKQHDTRILDALLFLGGVIRIGVVHGARHLWGHRNKTYALRFRQSMGLSHIAHEH